VKNYPAWICADCGTRLTKRHDERCMTFHQPDPADIHDHCGWCGTNTKALTEPRDYGFPIYRHPSASREGVKP
jgi:hypothetical protein